MHLYKSVFLCGNTPGKGETQVTSGELIARNIPKHEKDGWEFVCMTTSTAGLFRRVVNKDAELLERAKDFV